ncbi:hypothetical protein AB0878_34950 [Amycolatopsis sp. NPDC047767]|uniref:hypothetical protein n=1 Tax=Amycolatopsis sp. NPDC047767 TaxID=3156765 RepID=UPI0034571259
MCDDEEWARVSLRVSLESISLLEVEEKLGLRSSVVEEARVGANWWVRDMYESGDESLSSQLDLVSQVISERADRLANLPDAADINIMISWTPRRGQDSVGFDADFVSLLASVGGRLILDMHTDDCDCE